MCYGDNNLCNNVEQDLLERVSRLEDNMLTKFYNEIIFLQKQAK